MPTKDKHQHDWSEEQFVNRTDIKFKKCKKCGIKELPLGFYRIGEGKTVTILWPL